MRVDLHTHTSVSDGQLSPSELLHQAEAAGIDILSITDHDSTDAYATLLDFTSPSLTLIKGIEFSTEWKKIGIHIVGLNIQLDNDAILSGINRQRQARQLRAQCIAEKLQALGIEISWEGVKEIAGDGVIGRPHFARFLIDSGVVKDMNQAFDRYLGSGKAGDVKQFWAPFEHIIQWIRDAGGTAVLAHPCFVSCFSASLAYPSSSTFFLSSISTFLFLLSLPKSSNCVSSFRSIIDFFLLSISFLNSASVSFNC